MKQERITRRQFVGRSAATATATAMAATSYARVVGANDRLSVGIVGCGERMSALMQEVRRFGKKQNAEITAVCDIWNQRREEYAAKVGEWYGTAPRKCRTLADICALGDVDALVIATPDFAHSPHLAFAVKAGKDVYIEKPLGVDYEQVKKAVAAVRETGRIVQMGTQARRRGSLAAAREFVKAGGLGKVTYGEIYEPIFQERWRIPGCEKELTEKDTDWKEFQSYLYDPAKPFNARHYREFRLFWPYSSGCFAQWMSHTIDQIHIVIDEVPRYAVSWGGVYLWNDGRNNPDTVQTLLEYPSGMLVTYHMRMGNSAGRRGPVIYGTRGTLELFSDHAVGEGGGGTPRLVSGGEGGPYYEIDKSTAIQEKMPFPCPPDVEHMEDFLVGVRTRQRTRADIDAGYGHAVACIIADMAYRSGCRIEHDAAKQEVRKAPVVCEGSGKQEVGGRR
jgi:predicted dehydrogenase